MGQKSAVKIRASKKENPAQCSVFLVNRTRDSSFSPISTLRTPPFCPIFALFLKWRTEAFNISTESQGLSNMTDVQGYCMKCKQYGPIKDGKKIVMSNGRTRMAGFCSQSGCTGKISKIIA
jgi:hypothetical protein